MIVNNLGGIGTAHAGFQKRVHQAQLENDIKGLRAELHVLVGRVDTLAAQVNALLEATKKDQQYIARLQQKTAQTIAARQGVKRQ